MLNDADLDETALGSGYYMLQNRRICYKRHHLLPVSHGRAGHPTNRTGGKWCGSQAWPLKALGENTTNSRINHNSQLSGLATSRGRGASAWGRWGSSHALPRVRSAPPGARASNLTGTSSAFEAVLVIR